MSLLPLGGIVNSAAGAPFSQTAGSEAERTQRDSVLSSGRSTPTNTPSKPPESARRKKTRKRASATRMAAACGKHPRKRRRKRRPAPAAPAEQRQSKDASGLSGNNLDLTG